MNEPERTEWQIRCAFNGFCKRALKNESINAHKEIKRRQAREISFSDLTPKEENQLYTREDFFVGSEEEQTFFAGGKEWDAKTIADAIHSLPEEKRRAVLLYYFFDMSDAEIAREITLCAVPSMNIGNAHSNYSNKLWRQIRMRKNHSQVYRSAGSDCTEE